MKLVEDIKRLRELAEVAAPLSSIALRNVCDALEAQLSTNAKLTFQNEARIEENKELNERGYQETLKVVQLEEQLEASLKEMADLKAKLFMHDNRGLMEDLEKAELITHSNVKLRLNEIRENLKAWRFYQQQAKTHSNEDADYLIDSMELLLAEVDRLNAENDMLDQTVQGLMQAEHTLSLDLHEARAQQAHTASCNIELMRKLGKVNEALQLIADKAPWCNCMDAAGIARKALGEEK